MRLLIEFLYTGKVQESLEKLGGQQVILVDMASLGAQDKETVEKVTWLCGYIGNLVMRVKKQENKNIQKVLGHLVIHF